MLTFNPVSKQNTFLGFHKYSSQVEGKGEGNRTNEKSSLGWRGMRAAGQQVQEENAMDIDVSERCNPSKAMPKVAKEMLEAVKNGNYFSRRCCC